MIASVSLGSSGWLALAVVLGGLAMIVILTAYSRAAAPSNWKVAAVLLKVSGVSLLAACLVEPLYTGTRPRPGANVMLVVADNSKSLQLVDDGSQTRAELLRPRLSPGVPWLTRLAQDFEVRHYAFDAGTRPIRQFDELAYDGAASTLMTTLEVLEQRYRQHPVAGIIVLTDGNATDLSDREANFENYPPIYPVLVGTDSGRPDLAVTRVAVSQTNFEAAPVTILAEVQGRNLSGQKAIVRVLDEGGQEIERRACEFEPRGDSLLQRFLIRPERSGVSFYSVQVCVEGEEQLADAAGTVEATLANNRRLVTVDRGGGPYHVLYLTGKPNWEFKFLRRALDEDEELRLAALVRVAKKEPRFAFRGRSGERTNPLFRGFGGGDEETEQYDQPVLIRLGTEDKDELRAGFPKEAEELFRYHAIILDDVEAPFLTQDQHSLVQEFVSRRGGGLLMLGGKDSFVEGRYGRTPIGDMLPIYLDQSTAPPLAESYRLKLTREGWLQPWVRVRTNELDESKRLAEMPEFKTANRIGPIKPGAVVLAEVDSANSTTRPALVVQQFGRGRVGALLIADLWRWNMRRAEGQESDLDKSWRQTVRWLVSDVPQAVEVETQKLEGSAIEGVRIVARARDKRFEPLDNATAQVKIRTPDGHDIELAFESSERTPGQYEASFTPRVAGVYRAKVTVTAADGSEVGERDSGWAIEPDSEEFRQLGVNRELLERLAARTGGEVLQLDDLERFVGSLPNRKIPIVETWTYPLWHQWTMFSAALCCLVLEWGLRRWKGLP